MAQTLPTKPVQVGWTKESHTFWVDLRPDGDTIRWLAKSRGPELTVELDRAHAEQLSNALATALAIGGQ